MKLIMFGVLSFIFVIPAYSASFDCAKALTQVEKTLCAVDWLGKLDEELSYFYGKLRKELDTNSSLQLVNEQKEWIKERTKRCEVPYNNNRCLGKMYRQRVNELKIRYAELILLPDKKQLNSMCQELASLEPTGRLSYGDDVESYDIDKDITSFDVNNDGTKEIVKSCHGGTAHVPCVEYKSIDGTRLPRHTVNFEWKTYWTYGLSHFSKNGKWFRFHSYDDHFKKPAYVSYITPDNNEFVVCEFKTNEKEKVKYVSNSEAYEKLCNSVLKEELDLYSLDEKPKLTRRDIADIGRYETGLFVQGWIDYDNNGSDNYIGELHYASGAGRGCDYIYYDELNKDGDSFVDTEERHLLLDMQGVHLESGYRHPACGIYRKGKGYSNRFFKYMKKIYFEYNTPKGHAVYFIENNNIEKICTFDKLLTTEVTSVGVPNK